MEWIGLIALIILLGYSFLPGKTKELESKVKKLEKKIIKLVKNQGVDNSMSKIMKELEGKKCKIATDEALGLVGSNEINCLVLEVDDEWIKFTYTDKKNITKTRILRIESIDGVEVLDE